MKTNTTKSKKHIKFNLIIVLLFAVLMLYALSIIAVLLWGFLTSLKDPIDFRDFGNVLGFPDMKWSQNEVKFYNYVDMIQRGFKVKVSDKSYYSGIFGVVSLPERTVYFPELLLNTIVYAVVGALLNAFTAMTAGYLCAKFKYKYSSFVYSTMLIVMVIPIVGSTSSMLKVLYDLGLFSSYLGMIVMNINIGGMYFLVFYAFMKGLSNTFIEAAEIDGASQFKIFTHIIIPLSSKILFTVFLLQFISYWNDYQTPLVYYPTLPTLAYAVQQNEAGSQGGTRYNSVPLKVTACFIIAIPILIIFISLNKVILGSLSLGGVKE